MFRNYLVTALRNIARHKLYSFINIAGLAVGLACVIFIMLFIRDELSFDKWVPGSDNLYRVDMAPQLIPGNPFGHVATAPFPLPAFMKDNLPEVTAMTRLWPTRMTIQIGDRQFLEEVNEADANFFTVLGLPLVTGDPGQVLQRPESIVLSQALARKYFGTADPVGRLVVVSHPSCDDDRASCPEMASLRVSGVMRDVPYNTQFKIQAVIPHTSPADRIGEKGKEAWFHFNGFGYVRLAPGSDPAMVAAKLGPVMDRMVDLSAETGFHRPAGQALPVELVRFRDAHMSNHTGVRVPPGSWTTLYGLGLIGLVILMAACFNFTNLATARAMTRAREIGLRKCVGASRSQVAAQFLGESVLMAVMALVIALALVEILLPAYDAFLERPIALHYLQDWPLLLIILLIAAAAGLVSGIYPALVLSGFRPITALRSNQSGQAGSGGLRSALVVLQFAVSIALAIVTLVVFSQIDFARNQELGFRRDNVLVVGTGRMTPDARESFMAQLRAHPGITAVASSGDTPFSQSMRIESVQVPGQSATLTPELFQITPEFIDLYGIKLAAGRLLSDRRGEDSVINAPDAHNDGHNILINEAAARHLGFTVPGAVGKTIRQGEDFKNSLHIVGVLRDAGFKGARKRVQPTMYINDRKYSNVVSVRLTGRDVQNVIAFVDSTWHRMMPSAAISRTFLDDSFADLYRADVKQGEMFAIFVAIAIAISALGLFGLAAFSAERRTQEIGIRKVFGARTRDVVFLLLWQFSLPVVLANLLAWPLAWYYLQDWLRGFDYRITLSPLYFAAAGLAALLIAWVTVVSHALRVARANPIHALRYE